MYQIKIGEHIIDISNESLETALPIKSIGETSYETTWLGKKTIVDIVKIDEIAKTIVLRIASKKYTFQIKEPVDVRLEEMGIKPRQAKKNNNLKAPMPGMVLKVLVGEGQTVKAGESLLVLEAMKMENVFKAHADSVVKSVLVSERQTVEKGEDLILFTS